LPFAAFLHAGTLAFAEVLGRLTSVFNQRQLLVVQAHAVHKIAANHAIARHDQTCAFHVAVTTVLAHSVVEAAAMSRLVKAMCPGVPLQAARVVSMARAISGTF